MASKTFSPFLAVDPGTHSGACLWMGDEWKPRVRAGALRGDDARAVATTCDYANQIGATEAVIEQVPIFGRHGAGLRQIATMGELAGRWVQSAEEHGMRVVRVLPRVWQRPTNASAHRGETEADRDRRRILLATAILRAEDGTCVGPMTKDVACAVLIGAWYERARLIGRATP